MRKSVKRKSRVNRRTRVNRRSMRNRRGGVVDVNKLNDILNDIKKTVPNSITTVKKFTNTIADKIKNTLKID